MRAHRQAVAIALAALVLLTMAEPAVAADPGFKGRYFASWTPTQGDCGKDHYGVRIRYLSETRRRYDPAGTDDGEVLRYVAGERRPWQFNGADGGIALRYRPGTDSARGIAWEAECTWKVILGRSDQPSS